MAGASWTRTPQAYGFIFTPSTRRSASAAMQEQASRYPQAYGFTSLNHHMATSCMAHLPSFHHVMAQPRGLYGFTCPRMALPADPQVLGVQMNTYSTKKNKYKHRYSCDMMISALSSRDQLLPLLVVRASPFKSGLFKSKSRLQKAVYLVQSICGNNAYDFKGHPYGIYSERLDRDMMGSPALNSRQVLPYYDYRNSHYSITPKRWAREQLAQLQGSGLPDGMASALFKIKDMNDYAIADEAYSRFDPGGSLKYHRVEGSLRTAISKMKHCLDTNYGREPVFVMAMLEIIERCLPNLKDAPKLQRTVVLHLAQELVQRILDVSGKIAPPVDDGAVKGELVEISEIEVLFRSYCDDRGIMKDPFSLPLKEVFTKEQVDRICHALKTVKLPA